MRVRALALSLVGCAAALGLTWEVGQAAVHGPGGGAAAPVTTPPTSSTSSEPRSPSTSATAGAGPKRPSAPSGTFAGATAATAYGPMQVAIVVKNGRITDVKALQLTNQGGRSVAISASAVPVLRSEALRAQSAKIDAVSGATFTSDGYRRSLQSAIDKAGL